jgi:hypothetical protein
MGFARRVVRKSVRRATPRPVRQVMHPARTVRNAMTPRPVKQVTRTAYTVRHPVGAGENKLINAVLYPPRTHRRKRSFWSWLTGGNRQPAQPERRSPSPARVETSPHSTASRACPAPAQPRPAPQARRQPPIQPWPARQAFRTPPPGPLPPASQSNRRVSSAGQWELDARQRTGLGDGSRSQ